MTGEGWLIFSTARSLRSLKAQRTPRTTQSIVFWPKANTVMFFLCALCVSVVKTPALLRVLRVFAVQYFWHPPVKILVLLRVLRVFVRSP